MKKQNQYQTAEEWMGSQGRVVSTTNNRTGIQTAEEWMQANATAEKEKSAQIKSKANQLYTQFQNGPTGNTKKKPQVFSAGSSDLINRLVNDYKTQKAAYQDRLALEEERNTLEQQAKWLAEGSPEKKNALADIEKLNKKLAGSQAQKPRVPLLDQKDYSNSRSNAGKEDSATKALRAQAARLQQQMEQEQALWDAAQANAMGIGTQALAEAKRRYDQKYSEYSAHYNAIAKQLPGAWTEAELQQQRNMDKIRQLESQLPALYNVLYRRYPNGTPEQSPEYQKALAQVNRIRNQIAALKKEGAGLSATIDSERQERMGEPGEGKRITTVDAIGYDDPEKAELEIGTEEAMTNQQERFMEYLDLAANVESMGAPLEDVEAARDRRDNALGTIRESQQERAQAVRDRNEARLQERERGVSAYETDRYRDDFQKVSQNARRENPDKDTDPVGHYFANKGAEDLQEAVGGGTINRYNFLSDGEIDEYYYLLGSRGTDAAMDYLDALEVTLDKRIADFRRDNTEIAYGTSGGVGKTAMNAMSVPANVVGSITAGAADLINTVRGKYNPYSPGHELTDYAGTLRNVTARDIMGVIENPFWGAVAANTYQAVMSGADSALGATLFGNGYTWIMGSGAASQRAKELYEKGASQAQIGLGAIGSGLIEVATENYSIEYFTENFLKGNVTGFRDWMKKTLIQSLNEGSEEVASDLANLVVDAMLEGANSDYRDGIQALVAQGMSREEAEKKAFLNQAIDTFWSFYGGAVSGGMMGGVGGIVNATTSEARKTGKTLVDSGSYEEILRNALELNPENKDAAKLTDRAKKGTLGKRGSDYAKLTNIYQGILSELTQRDVSSVKNAVKAQAEQMGVKKNSDLVASGVVKKLMGEKPSMSERYAMAQNQKITDSLLGDIRKAGTGEEESAEWVRKIDTYAISHEGFGVRDTETAKSARAAVHDQLSQAAESIFGKEHAFAVEQLYNPMQSRGRYVEEMAKAYKAGQEGIEISQIQGVGSLTGAQVTLAYNLGKQSVDGSSFDYDGEANGQSYLISDNSPVNIQGIASAGGGGLVLLTDEGERVTAQDVKFGSYGTARLFKAIATMGVDAQTGNAILEASRNSRLSDSNFAVAVLDAYNGGRNGIALNAMGRDSNAMRLDEATRKIAWEAGRDSRRAQTRQKQQTIDQGKHRAQKGGLTIEDSAKAIGNLSQQQKNGMDAARLLSEMGLNISVYASTEEQRNAGMENGNIQLKDGSIRLDLNAGADGQGVMAFALSHEFTHFVEEFSPEKFRKFTEALFEAMGAEVDVNELIAAKAAALKQQGYKGLSDNELNDLAYSEVVAEMMETALTDTDVMERISARLQQTDKSLWGKIKKFLQGLVDRLKEAYRELNPDSSIAQLARDTIRSSQEALNAFADAAEDAVVNYRLQDGEKNNAPEGVQYSQRYLEAAENREIADMVQRVLSGDFKANDKVYLGTVSQKNAARIQEITGINVDGFRIAIEARQIEHILNRHGIEGSADHSMAAVSDISKIEYTLSTPDNIKPAGKTQAYTYMRNGKNRTADTVIYEKGIGERTYYAVQAVADTKAKTLYIVTAFIQKNNDGASQLIDANGPDVNAQDGSVVAPNERVAQPGVEVKGKSLNSSRTAMDSSGNALTGAQQKYFENSQVRDANGNLIPVYHTTYDEFFTFDRERLGENTLGNGTDAWLAATALVGHWFNTQDLSRQMGGKATDFYLNVENPYSVSSLNELASEIMAFSDDPDTAQAEYEDGNYSAMRAAAAAYVNSLRENGYDGIITPDAEFGGKSYVVLDSAQAKLTTNKNPTENPDIRFSQRISAEERVERMETEIQYLKKLVQIQRMGNKDYTLDRNSLKQLAAQLIREHNAKGNSTELAALLEDTYNYISRDKDMTWAGIEERAGKAADWLEEHRKEQRDEYAQEILDWMAKRHVRLSEGQIGEIKYSYGSVRDFQRAIRGSIVVDQKSNTSLDQFWQEAAAQFADQFDSEIPDTDMPGALAELVQRLQDSRSAADMEAEYYREQSRYDLVEKIYEMYWSAKPVESISDKLKGEIAQLKKERNAALEKAARAKTQQERVKQALADYRNQRDAEAKAMKKAYEAERRQIEQAYQQEMKTAAKEVREKAAKTEERFKLERVLSDLDRRLLSPTKTLYVPDSLQPAVTMAMQSIATIKQQEAQETARRVIARYGVQLEGLMKDPVKNAQAIAETEAKLQNVLERQRATVQNALERMQQAYTDLAEVNKGVFTQDYNEGILELIDDAKKAIGSSFYGELSIEQLQAVRRAYTAILNTIRNANKLHGENLKQGWAETAQQAMAEFREQRDKTPALGRLKQTMEKLSWNNEKPYYAFERMGSSVMMQLYENLRNGEDGWYRDFAEGRAYMLACMDKYHFDQWEDSLVEVEMADGEKVELDLQERMSLYAASKREQYQKHLTGEGFILTGSKRGGKDYKDYTSHVLALETVIQIRNGQVLGLTAEQIAYADEMQEYLSTVCAEQNNEVSRALYGVSKAKEKDYWPIKSSSIRSERVRNSQEFAGNRQKNAGHMKNTVKNASNAVELGGFMVTWANHVNDTAMYHNITLPMEDFFRVYNYKTDGDSIRQQMLRKHGEASVAYVDTLLKDVNGGVRADGREAVYNLFLSGFKKAAVSASLSVAIQQPSAVGRAFSIIDAKYFVGFKVDSAGGISATWEEMKKYAPVTGLKEIGRFDTDMGRSTQELLSGKNEKGFMAAVDKISGWMPEQMDKITWIAMWEAAKRQTKAEHPGLSGEALKMEAGKLFTKCITQTQVYDSVFSRSGNMRSKSLYMKMLTSFMAEPTTTINMMESAIRDIRRKNFKAGNKKIASVAAALILNSLLASLVYAARDDDEEKTYLEKYLSSLSSELVEGVNPITYYPGFKDVWSIVQGYDVERNDMSLVSSMYKAVRKATSSWQKYLETDEDDQEARKESLEKFGVDSLDAAAGLLNLGGIPAKNILRELRGAKNTYDTVSTPRASDSYTRGKAIWEGIQENIPAIFRGSNGKTERLYSAIVSGSQAEQERLRATYSTEKKYENAIVTALADQDGRIRQAAKAKAAGNAKEAEGILSEIEAEGHFSRKQIQSAFEKKLKKVPGGSKESVKEQYLNGEIDRSAAIKQLTGVLGMQRKDAEAQVTQWNSVRDTGIEYDEIRDSYLNNTLTESRAAQLLVRYGGKSEEAAKKTVKEWGCKKDLDVNYSDLKDAFLTGEITEQQLKNALIRYGGKDTAEAEETVGVLRWQKKHPDSELSNEQVLAYTRELDNFGKSIEAAGIGTAVFADYRNRRAKCTGVDADGDGRTDSGSKKEEILALIDSLPLTSSQKDALYFDNGYAQSGLRKAPWNRR